MTMITLSGPKWAFMDKMLEKPAIAITLAAWCRRGWPSRRGLAASQWVFALDAK
jgi:hypothetical protein